MSLWEAPYEVKENLKLFRASGNLWSGCISNLATTISVARKDRAHRTCLAASCHKSYANWSMTHVRRRKTYSPLPSSHKCGGFREDLSDRTRTVSGRKTWRQK